MILEQVSKENQAEWQPDRKKGVFRGSELSQCPRAIQYAVLGKQKEPISAELALLFKDGHMHHDQLRGLLSKTGSVTNVEQGGYKEYEVDEIKFAITGTMDCLYNGEIVIDIKSMNCFTFKILTRDYLKQKYPGYIYQLQIYMDLFNKQKGLLLFKDKNSSQLKAFWYEKDEATLQQALSIFAKIHKATSSNKMIKRPYVASSVQCKRCQMRIHCYNKPMARWGS